MTVRTITAPLTALALCLALSACGGGGGDGGVSSTPAPTPTPTPTPTTGANDDLLTPLASESFAYDATTSRGTFPSVSNLSAGPSTTSFIYDQTIGSYTIQTQGRSQTFASANKDTTQSSAQITTYKKVTGNTTDLLTLTNPGTSGTLQYRYVGGGFWQRSVSSTNSVDGSFDAFTYGVATPNASVPRTGAAAYDFDIIGVLGRASGAAPYGLGGAGTLTVDFGASRFDGSGQVNLVDSQTGATVEFGTAITMNGTLGSANGFTGSFVYDPQGSRYAGGIYGRFYGPAAEEVGAAIYGVTQNQAFPGALSAALIGRKSTSGSGTNLSLVSLVASQTFYSQGAHQIALTDPANGTIRNLGVDEPAQFTGSGSLGPQIAYNAPANSYTITDSWQGGSRTATFAPAQLASTSSDPRFTDYRSASGANSDTLHLYKVGAGNPELALTYTGFGVWDAAQNPASDGLNHLLRTYFVYGITTTAFPRTGTANFTSMIHGSGGSSAPGSAPLDVSGEFRFAVDFAADSLSGTFSPVGKNTLTGVQSSLGNYLLTNTRGPFSAYPGFDGALQLTGATQPTGAFKGQFFGPGYTEVGGTFAIREADSANPGQNVSLSGAFVGKKVP